MKAAWAHAAIFGIVILVLTSMPAEAVPLYDTLDISDLLAHAILYTILGLLVMRAAALTWGHRGFRIYASNAWLIAAGFGAVDELHQLLIPYRFCSLWDWIADAVGCLLAVVIWRLYGSTSDSDTSSNSDL